MSNSLFSLKTVIRTKNFEASKTFYGDILGLKIDEEYDDGDGSKGVIFSIGGEPIKALIEISEIKKHHNFHDDAFDKSFRNNKVGIQIRTNDIDYWAKRLKDKWKAEGPVTRPWGSQYLYLRDPDDLHMIIYQET